MEPDSLVYLLSQRKVIGLAVGMGSYNYVFYLLLTCYRVIFPLRCT
jgi:hypothetical protein